MRAIIAVLMLGAAALVWVGLSAFWGILSETGRPAEALVEMIGAGAIAGVGAFLLRAGFRDLFGGEK